MRVHNSLRHLCNAGNVPVEFSLGASWQMCLCVPEIPCETPMSSWCMFVHSGRTTVLLLVVYFACDNDECNCHTCGGIYIHHTNGIIVACCHTVTESMVIHETLRNALLLVTALGHVMARYLYLYVHVMYAGLW